MFTGNEVNVHQTRRFPPAFYDIEYPGNVYSYGYLHHQDTIVYLFIISRALYHSQKYMSVLYWIMLNKEHIKFTKIMGTVKMKNNWFDTLNESLESEGLVDLWPLGSNIDYGQYVQHIVGEGKEEQLISVFRENDGRYERPIHYHSR